jgi:hypothetical protein
MRPGSHDGSPGSRCRRHLARAECSGASQPNEPRTGPRSRAGARPQSVPEKRLYRAPQHGGRGDAARHRKDPVAPNARVISGEEDLDLRSCARALRPTRGLPERPPSLLRRAPPSSSSSIAARRQHLAEARRSFVAAVLAGTGTSSGVDRRFPPAALPAGSSPMPTSTAIGTSSTGIPLRSSTSRTTAA